MNEHLNKLADALHTFIDDSKPKRAVFAMSDLVDALITHGDKALRELEYTLQEYEQLQKEVYELKRMMGMEDAA